MKLSIKLCLLIFVLFLAVFGVNPAQAKDKKPWTPAEEIKPADKVCLWDIHLSDPLVDNVSSDSLKFWYRPSVEKARSVYQMRPVTKGLLLRVLYPGLKVNKRGKDGDWYSFSAVVIKGGHKKLSDNARPIKIGKTVLMRDFGTTWPLNWQLMTFENARVRKKGMFGCERKYKKF